MFLLRTLNAPDIALLKQIGEPVGSGLGCPRRHRGRVARRRDRRTHRRDDVGRSGRFTAELDRTGVRQAVVPVSLLALTARTLQQSEFTALQKLAALDGDGATALTKAMLSADRFARQDDSLPVDAITRAALLDRFGMFGIRIAIAVLRAGVTDSQGLADELLDRSGLVALRDVIDRRSSRSAPTCSRHTPHCARCGASWRANPIYATPFILADIDPLLADTVMFEELRLLGQLRSRPTTLNDDEMASLRRIIGGLEPTRRAGWAEQRRAVRRIRGRPSRRCSGGAAGPITRSTTPSPHAPAGPPQRRGPGRGLCRAGKVRYSRSLVLVPARLPFAGGSIV